MRHNHFTAFDDTISGSTPVYTSTQHNASLGQYSHFAIGVVIDNVSAGATTFDLTVEHSSDGRNWLARNDASQTSPPPAGGGAGDITLTGLTTGTTYVKMFADPCILQVGKPGGATTGFPLLTFVRFRLQLNGNSAHVKVHVTHR